MLQKIEIFFLVLSVIFCLQYFFKIVHMIRQDNPYPISVSTTEKILIYLSLSYLLTFIITIVTSL
jgi:hypothetical protein